MQSPAWQHSILLLTLAVHDAFFPYFDSFQVDGLSLHSRLGDNQFLIQIKEVPSLRVLEVIDAVQKVRTHCPIAHSLGRELKSTTQNLGQIAVIHRFVLRTGIHILSLQSDQHS